MIIRGTRRWTPAALVLAVVAALTAAVLAAPAEAATTPSVQGIVTAADGSGPIAGIEVCAVRRDGANLNQRTCAETAADGSYAIQLTKGKFSLEAEQPYLYGSWVQQDYQAGKTFTFTSTTKVTADFALVRGARISGHITPPDGAPTINFGSIRAYRVDSAGKTASDSNYLSNMGSDGYFSIAKLPAGTYKLQIDEVGWPIYTNQWYPAASSANAAEPITVETGQAVGGRDITLTRTGTITINLLQPRRDTLEQRRPALRCRRSRDLRGLQRISQHHHFHWTPSRRLQGRRPPVQRRGIPRVVRRRAHVREGQRHRRGLG